MAGLELTTHRGHHEGRVEQGAYCAVVDPQGACAEPGAAIVVADRPGHDLRYAIDASKISRELGWRPSVTVEEGMRRTVRWYLHNRGWWEKLRAGGRLGLSAKS